MEINFITIMKYKNRIKRLEARLAFYAQHPSSAANAGQAKKDMAFTKPGSFKK